MVSVQTSPTLSYVVLPEGTRRGSVFTVHETGVPVPPKLRVLERVRAALRIRHYSRRTEEAYVAWIYQTLGWRIEREHQSEDIGRLVEMCKPLRGRCDEAV